MHTRTFQRAALGISLLLAGAALAACETTGGPAPQAAAVPMTHQEASVQCWMGTEKEAARMTLDKRADIVDACIERKMKGEPEASPGSSTAKPDAGPKADVKPKS